MSIGCELKSQVSEGNEERGIREVRNSRCGVEMGDE